MTTYLGKSCSFGFPRVPFVDCRQFMYLVISPLGFEGRMWDLIVSVPDHCLSFYLAYLCGTLCYLAVFSMTSVFSHFGLEVLVVNLFYEITFVLLFSRLIASTKRW